MQGFFYDKGLRFSCVRCSRCCRIEPGYVFLSQTDMKKLSRFFSLDNEQFLETYCRKIQIGPFSRYSLKERENYDCILWNDGKCVGYDSRPLQCSTYPFWPANLMDEKNWNALAETCPGINKGKLHTKQEILDALELRQREPIVSC